MLAVMLAALMSSLTSIFNSSSTIFTMDIYPRLRSNPSEVELLLVGRMFVLFLVAVSIVWIPIIQASQGSQLFNYIQSITSYLAPPICSVYLLAIFWPRTNEPGAFWGLMVGLVIGLIRFGLEFSTSLPACGDFESQQPAQWWQDVVGDIHYLHFGLILWAISGLVAVSVSLVTPPPPAESLHRLTWWTRSSLEVRPALDNDTDTAVQTTTNTRQSGICQGSTLIFVFLALKSELPRWKIVLNWICGVEMADKPADIGDTEKETTTKTPEEIAEEAVGSLYEPEWKRNLVDANAVLVMSVAMFFWGFYN